MKKKIHYEARLNKKVVFDNYGKMTYKKGFEVDAFSESEFKKFTKKNIEDKYVPLDVVGHGNSNYFDLKDIEFVKVETVIKLKVTKVKLK